MKKLYTVVKIVFLWAALLLIAPPANAQQPPKPLFDDPVYHGAADPVVVWSPKAKQWWMFYTNRRAGIQDTTGVKWVHGTRIGIATSADGSSWKYLDTANINYRPDEGYTFWAPDVIEHKGTWHMYLTYVPGIFTDWQHPRYIIHCTSKDLRNWKYEDTLSLSSRKVIDASVCKTADGWRMWYNNEKDKKTIYYADSKDLYHWDDKGKAVDTRGEGPKVFAWQGSYYMIIDQWKGMAVLHSTDMLHWTPQPARILEQPGTGKDDQAIGGHCDVVVNNGRAYIFYFTHPGHSKQNPASKGSFEDRRSVIQLAELKLQDGNITCDRDAPVTINLK